MFELMLGAMVQMQQIIGQENWEKMHAGPMGQGFGPQSGMHGRGSEDLMHRSGNAHMDDARQPPRAN